MDKLIYAAAEKMIEPMMDEFCKQYKAQRQAEQSRKGRIRKPDALIQQEIDESRETLMSWLVGEEEITRLEQGFKTLLEELDRVPNKQAIIDEILQVRNELSQGAETQEEDLPYVFDTLQEMFGLSKETYRSFYQIGSQLFNEGKKDQALNIFILLTNLNHLVFDPWLGQGLCWQNEENYIEALRAFSMATFVSFEHPAPHIYSAECYLSMGNKDSAKESLDLALATMSIQQKKEYKAHIEAINRYIKK